MFRRRLGLKSVLTAAAIGIFSITGPFGGLSAASAATVPCGTDPHGDISTRVSVATGCEVSDTYSQDFLNLGAPGDPLAVNRDGFFGRSDWSFVSKQDGVNATSGAFDLTSLGIAADRLMLVFKAANSFFITGYTISDLVGSWESPFADTNPNGKKRFRDVSHISIYAAPATTIPLPASALLLIGGLGALTALRRRKSA